MAQRAGARVRHDAPACTTAAPQAWRSACGGGSERQHLALARQPSPTLAPPAHRRSTVRGEPIAAPCVLGQGKLGVMTTHHRQGRMRARAETWRCHSAVMHTGNGRRLTFSRVALMWAMRSSTKRRLPQPTLPATSSSVPFSRPIASGTISLQQSAWSNPMQPAPVSRTMILAHHRCSVEPRSRTVGARGALAAGHSPTAEHPVVVGGHTGTHAHEVAKFTAIAAAQTP